MNLLVQIMPIKLTLVGVAIFILAMFSLSGMTGCGEVGLLIN